MILTLRRAPRLTRAQVESTLIAIGVLVLATCLEFRISSDGDQRFRDLRLLIRQHRLSSTPYSLFGPVLATPLYVIGQRFLTPRFWVARFNFVIFLVGLAVMWRILRRHGSQDQARRFVLLMLCASVFPAHARDFFGEMLTAMLASIGLLALTLDARVSGAVALGLSAVNQPASVVAVSLATGQHLLRDRRLRIAVAAAAPLALIALENALRRGHPVTTGYEGSAGTKTLLPYSGLIGFSYPLVFGVLSILMSFGKGLVFFMPGLLLPLGGALRQVRWAFLAYLAGLILVYAKWWSWYGGWVWGPRFFAIGSTLACLALANALEKPRRASYQLLIAGLVTWSAWVAVDGTVYELHGVELCLDNYQHQYEFLCWYVPEFSPLFRPFVVSKSLTVADLSLLVFHAVAATCLVGPTLVSALRDNGHSLIPRFRRLTQGWRW